MEPLLGIKPTDELKQPWKNMIKVPQQQEVADNDSKEIRLQSAFYDAFSQHKRGKRIPALFSLRDEELHSSILRPVAQAYWLSALLNYEALVDTVIKTLLDALDERFAIPENRDLRQGMACDIGQWLQFFACDAITAITFGQPMGLLQSGEDMSDFIQRLDKAIDADAPISQMPWMGYLKKKNPLNRFFAKDSNFTVSFVEDRIRERPGHLALSGERDAHRLEDLLDKYISAEKSYDIVEDGLVRSYAMSTVASGSDSISIPLRSVIYLVLRNPNVYEKVTHEVRNAGLQSPTQFRDVLESLPYLGAVIKEALRLHPPVGLGLERTMPDTGLQLKNQPLIPSGTQVSVCAWVVHLDHEIFGHDSGDFVPERWLRADEETYTEYTERLARMQRFDFSFGHGSRTCIGKNMSLILLYKVLASLFMELDMVSTGEKWMTRNSWFVRQWNVKVHLRRRREGSKIE
uniref:Cytochrome P450 n=1 Tax=Bionectria ochroleuca TaxID=29856 RepID=A0A8H7N270_BIOOC